MKSVKKFVTTRNLVYIFTNMSSITEKSLPSQFPEEKKWRPFFKMAA